MLWPPQAGVLCCCFPFRRYGQGFQIPSQGEGGNKRGSERRRELKGRDEESQRSEKAKCAGRQSMEEMVEELNGKEEKNIMERNSCE